MFSIKEVSEKLGQAGYTEAAKRHALRYDLAMLAALVNYVMGQPRTNYVKISFLCDLCGELTTNNPTPSSCIIDTCQLCG